MKRTVIVTGGTRGIGKAISIRLLDDGYNVVLNYRSNDDAARATMAACEKYSESALLIKADVALRESVDRLMNATIERFGGIDILINNAGRNIDKSLFEMTDVDFDTVVDANLRSVFMCSQKAARHMIDTSRQGLILNMGATTAIRGRVNGVNYCSSKAGVLAITKCLALELAPQIRVNCVIPGTIRVREVEAPERLRAKEATIPLGRLGTTAEMAQIVSFLCSDAAVYINGQKIIVDGGQFMY